MESTLHPAPWGTVNHTAAGTGRINQGTPGYTYLRTQRYLNAGSTSPDVRHPEPRSDSDGANLRQAWD